MSTSDAAPNDTAQDVHAEAAEAPAENAPPPAASPKVSFWAQCVDWYFSFDRRTLGMTRIFLGFLVFMDCIHRSLIWEDMYGDKGVLPAPLYLQRPQSSVSFSFFTAFVTNPELRILWLGMLVTSFCLMIGYRTKLMQILTMFFVTSMNGRLLLIENGGYVVNNLLTLWTMFLPLGDRFSVDAMLASMKNKRESTEADLNDRSDQLPASAKTPYVTVVGLILLLQLAAIYYFNVIHKKGIAWHNGQAVHFVLYVDRMVTPLIGVVRDYIPNWATIALTRMTIAFEAALPFALLVNLARPWMRRAAIAMINMLHIGFGTSMVLGPFAWSCCTFSTLLFGKEDWDIAYRTTRRAQRARTVLYDPESGAAFWVCRVLTRLDNFELLTFRAAPGLREGLAVKHESEHESQRKTHAAMVRDVVSALPLGPAISWLFTVPGLSQITTALVSRLEGGRASRTFGVSVPKRTVIDVHPAPLTRAVRGVWRGFLEVAAFIMFIGAVDQACNELWCVRERIKVPQPEPIALLSHKLRFLQGWFMFSPNPVMDDGTLIVDAITVDGRHINPFTGKAPDFDLLNAKSLRYNQMWCDYYSRIHTPGNNQYRDAMREYMLRLPERTGNPNDALVSGDVFWIQDMNPQWGSTKSWKFEQNKLFSFDSKRIN
jgi:hypothetical protein